VQTAPPGGSFAINVVSADVLNKEDFGNFFPITISGVVFNDINGNGARDSGDPGLQGWTIQRLDSNNNVVESQVTDVNGTYSFTNVGPGTFTLREVLQNGWTQTFPVAPGTHTFTGSSGMDITSGEDFGNFQ